MPAGSNRRPGEPGFHPTFKGKTPPTPSSQKLSPTETTSPNTPNPTEPPQTLGATGGMIGTTFNSNSLPRPPIGWKTIHYDPQTGAFLTVEKKPEVEITSYGDRYDGHSGGGEFSLRIYRPIIKGKIKLVERSYEADDETTGTIREFDIDDLTQDGDNYDAFLNEDSDVTIARFVYSSDDGKNPHFEGDEIVVDGILPSGEEIECSAKIHELETPEDHYHKTTSDGNEWLISEVYVPVSFNDYGADDPDAARDRFLDR